MTAFYIMLRKRATPRAVEPKGQPHSENIPILVFSSGDSEEETLSRSSDANVSS
ncbi:MAG: hypothetical protein ACUVQ0_04770 [Thermoproteota archaeon]